MRAVCLAVVLIGLPINLSAETIETVAGAGGENNNGDSGGTLEVNIGQPFGVEFGSDGALYVCEVSNHRVWRVNLKSKRAKVVAGNGTQGYAGDGGPAIDAAMNEPYEIRFDRAGNMYIVEMKNHVVRRIDVQTGAIDTIAGNGSQGFGGDGGPATDASLSHPHSIALDEEVGRLYIADIGNHRIRSVDLATGVIDTVAGNGQRALPIDGAMAKGKAMAGPRALFIRPGDRTLWIALREGHSVWRLGLDDGVLNHVAGTGEQGWNDEGQGVAPDKVLFNGPKGIAVDKLGRIYVVDTENQAIRKIDLQTRNVTTVAGGGPNRDGFGGDGGPSTGPEVRLGRPHGVCVGPDGAVYIGDTNNHRVRRIELSY